ncbi:hypothetical protein BDK51DRAFT_17303 [Blyttiomyces helicus]|uniref:Uncharacterized protein n=1 Tax=Blyttiomyces helicus TaxID=388810 RepID=A0A4P9WE80_9FUNG|nr:hypothetical protein BDK51DRAFT_17303 [Blyttiomyces helicus]|eukprot:RKO88686.1 hypothetical protein BDK51DRAFT_17303 [Blyttiomyces helicus]
MLNQVAIALGLCCAYSMYSRRSKEKAAVAAVAAGERVVIVGASSGIGEALALQYAARGANLLLVARRQPLLESVHTRCAAAASVHLVVADITVEEDVARVSGAAQDLLGGVDTLIINAGALSVLPFEDVARLDSAAEVVERLFKVNVFGPIALARSFLPLLIESKGKFVVVSSLAGVIAAPTRSLYSSTKFAIQGFFSAFRIEVAKHGVAVCLVLPSSVDTDLRSSAVDAATPAAAAIQAAAAGGSKLSAEQCATAIVRAADRRARETYVPGVYWWVALANFLFPEIVERGAARKYGYA